MAANKLIPIATLILLLSCQTFPITAATRDTLGTIVNRSHSSLSARLKGEDGGGMMECWTALLELKSCTNEIILFFINGEGYLGMECCRAIRTITHSCWPSMLMSLGYTSEEGGIVSDYCGGSPTPQPAAVDGAGVKA